MADPNDFKWFRPGHKLVELNFMWKVKVPFLHTTGKDEEQIQSGIFPSEETLDSNWKLLLYDRDKEMSLCTWHYNSRENIDIIPEEVLVKISILSGKGRKVFQKMMASEPKDEYVEFLLIKEDIIKSQCQHANGSLTFCCKIFSHIKKEPALPADLPGLAMDCSIRLSTQFQKLYDEMKFSDVIFKVRGHEFPAHKIVLTARSEVLDAMFQHPTKENLTNQIEIEDVEPIVFQELLRFIYTGRLSTVSMETFAVGLLIAADKYLLDDLKVKCENYLVREMSPDNCIELLLHGDLLNPAEFLKKSINEAAKFFRRLPSEVIATKRWEQMEELDPWLLLKIQKILFVK
jgi:speckle-type POZ protein